MGKKAMTNKTVEQVKRSLKKIDKEHRRCFDCSLHSFGDRKYEIIQAVINLLNTEIERLEGKVITDYKNPHQRDKEEAGGYNQALQDTIDHYQETVKSLKKLI